MICFCAFLLTRTFACLWDEIFLCSSLLGMYGLGYGMAWYGMCSADARARGGRGVTGRDAGCACLCCAVLCGVWQVKQTRAMLLMIPSDVLDAIPAVRELLKNSRVL